MDPPAVHEHGLGEKVATVQVPAVHRDEVDFSRAVGRSDTAVRCEPAGLQGRDDHVALNPAPLALNPQQLAADFQTEVVSAVLPRGEQNRDAQPGRFLRDCHLRQRALVVRIPEHMFA